MPCALRRLRAACAQLRRRYYGSVCLRLRLEARRSHRQTPPRGSGAHHRFCGHLRRNPRNPDHSGDYSRNYGLNRTTDGFSCSRGGQHTWIYYLIPELRMMAASDGSSSCGFWWIIGAPPLSRCRDSVWRTEDSCPGCHGGRGQRPVHLISLWILTEEQEYSGMFSADERSCGS